MKTNNNHNHQACEFAIDSIEYLYGEIGETRKTEFETHLNNCLACSAELGSFVEVRSAISDWKTYEFSNLKTPVISIPYETATIVNSKLEETNTWLDNLRGLFNLSPVWSAGAACVLFVIFGGLVLFAFNSFSENEVADAGTNKQVKAEVSPSVEREIKQEISPSKSDKSLEQAKTTQNDSDEKVDIKSEVKKDLTVKPATTIAEKRRRVPPKVKNSPILDSQQQTAVKVMPKASETQKPPRLNNLPEEEEDDSLRLTDLFAELETE